MDIIPVDDSPFKNGNAHATIPEDGEITFNEEDLLALFGDVDSSVSISRIITAEGDEAEGDITDNGDGTWTLVPTGDFAGTTGLEIVVSDGNTETSMDFPVYIRPVADGTVITTAHDGPLVFGEDTTGHFALNVEMLDASETMVSLVMTGYPIGFVVSDGVHTIGFVVSDGVHTIEITEEGQMVNITEWDLTDLSMNPPEDYNGNFFVTVSSVTLDVGDESSLEDDSQLINDVPAATPFQMHDDGSILIEADDLLETQGLDSTETNVEEVNYEGEDGVLIDNDNRTWTFWSDPDYSGPVDVSFTTDTGDSYSTELQIMPLNDIAADSVDVEVEVAATAAETQIVTEEQLLENVDTIQGDTLTVSNVQSDNALITDLLDGTFSVESTGWADPELSFDVSNGIETVSATTTLTTEVEAEPDYTVAPGGVVNIAIPDEISGNDSVDHMILSGLPEGVTPQSGVESDEGYIIGDTSQPITLNIDSSFSGDTNVQMSGMSATDQPIDGAVGGSTVEVDTSYEMQGSSADTAAPINSEMAADGGDWTTADNIDVAIDVMDDAASFADSGDSSADDDTHTIDESI